MRRPAARRSADRPTIAIRPSSKEYARTLPSRKIIDGHVLAPLIARRPARTPSPAVASNFASSGLASIQSQVYATIFSATADVRRSRKCRPSRRNVGKA